TITATISGISSGKVYYLKASSIDPYNPFKTGNYALTLNMGNGATPTVPMPSTQTKNGTPLSSGGGLAVKVDYEIQANSTVEGDQSTATGTGKTIATDSQGNYIIVWASNGQDGSGWGIFAQRYTAAGVPLGSEFQVNTTTVG